MTWYDIRYVMPIRYRLSAGLTTYLIQPCVLGMHAAVCLVGSGAGGSKVGVSVTVLVAEAAGTGT